MIKKWLAIAAFTLAVNANAADLPQLPSLPSKNLNEKSKVALPVLPAKNANDIPELDLSIDDDFDDDDEEPLTKAPEIVPKSPANSADQQKPIVKPDSKTVEVKKPKSGKPIIKPAPIDKPKKKVDPAAKLQPKAKSDNQPAKPAMAVPALPAKNKDKANKAADDKPAMTIPSLADKPQQMPKAKSPGKSAASMPKAESPVVMPPANSPKQDQLEIPQMAMPEKPVSSSDKNSKEQEDQGTFGFSLPSLDSLLSDDNEEKPAKMSLPKDKVAQPPAAAVQPEMQPQPQPIVQQMPQAVVQEQVTAKDVANELAKIIDKTVSETRLNKHEVSILEELLVDQQEDIAKTGEAIISKTELEESQFPDLYESNQENTRQQAIIAKLTEQIDQLDQEIAKIADKNSSYAKMLLNKRHGLVIERRFNLDYETNVVLYPKNINAKSNDHLPNDFTEQDLLPYIYRAISENNMFKLEQLLEMAGSGDILDEHGNNLVMKAAMFDNQRALEFLVQKYGMSLHLANNYDATPLHVASMNGNAEMVRFLLGNNASLIIEDQAGKTAIDYARIKGNTEVIALFNMIDPDIRLD